MLVTRRNFRTVNSVFQNHVRGVQSNDSLLDNCERIRNKNPRNLELLAIARKPAGWHLEKPGREYWHKLVLTKQPRHITLVVHHFENGPVISASTKEWALKKQLSKLCDANAYINLGRVMAQRCLESGITSLMPIPSTENNIKLNLLLNQLKESGLIFEEPERFKTPLHWHKHSQEKPWEVVP